MYGASWVRIWQEHQVDLTLKSKKIKCNLIIKQIYNYFPITLNISKTCMSFCVLTGERERLQCICLSEVVVFPLVFHSSLTWSFLSHHPKTFRFVLPFECIQIQDTNEVERKRPNMVFNTYGFALFECQTVQDLFVYCEIILPARLHESW